MPQAWGHTHTHTYDMQHLRLPTRAWRPHAMATTTTHKGRATEQRRKWVACRTRFIGVTTGVWCRGGGGGRLQPVLMRDLPQLSVKTCGEGVGGRVGGGGGLHATHYHHMHTSRVCVCLGAWGYGGMYGIIAIVFARKKVLRVVRTKGIVPLSTEHGTKNGTHTAIFQNARGGGGGLGGVAGPGPAAPPRGLVRDEGVS